MKQAMIGVALLLLGVGGGIVYVTSQRAARPGQPTPAQPAASTVAAGVCEAHAVPTGDCPWCDPSLIKSKGHCGGHDVPEALCSRCNATLIPGFKAVNDWCAGHDLPESQCAKCLGGDLPPGELAPGEGPK